MAVVVDTLVAVTIGVPPLVTGIVRRSKCLGNPGPYGKGKVTQHRPMQVEIGGGTRPVILHVDVAGSGQTEGQSVPVRPMPASARS